MFIMNVIHYVQDTVKFMRYGSAGHDLTTFSCLVSLSAPYMAAHVFRDYGRVWSDSSLYRLRTTYRL